MNLKSIAINFPEFELDLNEKFTKGINVIEWVNGYGKTTLINTVISFITWKFPWHRINPAWSAVIESDKGKHVLSAKRWIWTEDYWYLWLYSFVWKFFEISTTTEQRKVLIDLLDIDYEKFVWDAIGKLWDDYQMLMDHSEKDLRKMFKDVQAKENVLLEDIMKYKSFIKEFVDENFDDVIFYLKNKDSLIQKIAEYNASLTVDNITPQITWCTLSIERYERDLISLRNEYTTTQKNECPRCLTKLVWDMAEPLDKIKVQAGKITALKTAEETRLKELQEQKKWFINQIKLSVMPEDLAASSHILWVEITNITDKRLEEFEEYKFQMNKFSIYRDDLKSKEDQLKELNTEIIKDCLLELDLIKKEFTTFLKKKTDKLPVKIELFKTQKNWEVKETFDIIYQNKSYNGLSTGNKMIVQVMLAAIFADKLWLGFIMIDEWNSISKNNLNYIADLATRKQVIIMKATGWNKKDIKLDPKK